MWALVNWFTNTIFMQGSPYYFPSSLINISFPLTFSVRINAGALPRGLHMLNLSKNNISTIEGLRELTRLRVLDLSYNRIIRIGHGMSLLSKHEI